MQALQQPFFAKRYQSVCKVKAWGTINPIADFIAQKIVKTAGMFPVSQPLKILIPAMGQGELLLSLLECLKDWPNLDIDVFGFETDVNALKMAATRLNKFFPNVSLHLQLGDFLEFHNTGEAYDLIIANPPCDHTSIIEADRELYFAKQFGLSGHVDLYHPFILGLSQVLKPDGVAGIITSNRFLTAKSGAGVRRAVCKNFRVHHVWDLGDSRTIDTVLPVVLVVVGKRGD